MGDRAVDGRTDLYSLGAMTYEMLAGEPPHVHEPIALGLDSRHDGLGPAVHNRAAGLGDPPGERADAGARHRASNHCGTQYYGATTGDEQRPCSPPTELVARSQLRHTTQRRPRAGSNATRSPTGNASSDSLPLSDLWQKMQVENIAAGPRPARQVLPAFHMPKSRRLTRTHWRIVNIPDTYKPASEPDSHRAGASP